MKLLLTLLLLITLFTTLALSKTDYENAILCARKTKYANTAISAFCSKKNAKGQPVDNLHVPSKYAKNGANVGKAVMRAYIKGTCNPPQWVPLNYCNSQFHEMCAQSTYASGVNERKYGKNGCQRWILSGDDKFIAGYIKKGGKKNGK